VSLIHLVVLLAAIVFVLVLAGAGVLLWRQSQRDRSFQSVEHPLVGRNTDEMWITLDGPVTDPDPTRGHGRHRSD
jgi:hypothetical protein